MSDLCLVHLVWKPLGPAYLRRFLEAYRAVPAGRDHRLVILLNGFAGGDAGPWRALLSGVAHDEILLEAPVQDIAAYDVAARRLDCELLCFCNSYSEPLVDGWLACLHAHAARDEVGLAGGSGSWESHRHNLERLLTPAGLVDALRDRLARRAAEAPREVASGTPAVRATFRDRFAALRRERAAARVRFERAPAPHVRTNGFMIRRALWTDLEIGTVREKGDALAFESGRWSLTRQVEARGLAAVVVGADGAAWAPADWWRSGCYRSGRQENLLLSDNRTAEFAAMSPARQARVRALTWGADPLASSAVVASRPRPQRPAGWRAAPS